MYTNETSYISQLIEFNKQLKQIIEEDLSGLNKSIIGLETPRSLASFNPSFGISEILIDNIYSNLSYLRYFILENIENIISETLKDFIESIPTLILQICENTDFTYLSNKLEEIYKTTDIQNINETYDDVNECIETFNNTYTTSGINNLNEIENMLKQDTDDKANNQQSQQIIFTVDNKDKNYCNNAKNLCFLIVLFNFICFTLLSPSIFDLPPEKLDTIINIFNTLISFISLLK